MYLKTFTVRGRGEFPLDMLRYDSCWPATGEDVAKIAPTYELAKTREEMAVREVTLKKYVERKTSIVTSDRRWDSFHWQVIKVD